MGKIKDALKLAKDCTFADAMTEGAKEHLRNKIDEALEEMHNLNKELDSIIEGLEKKDDKWCHYSGMPSPEAYVDYGSIRKLNQNKYE